MYLNLFRHGQSYVNSPDWQSLENQDAGLTEKGNQQAAALRDWLKASEMKADVLYASTMQRTRETAQYVSEAMDLKPIFDDRIREIGTVYSDGKPIAGENLPRSYITQTPRLSHAPVSADVTNIETGMQGRNRMGQFVDELITKHLGETVYLVVHGGVIDGIIANIFNIGWYRPCDIHSNQTSWTLLEYRVTPDHEGWHLHHVNRVDHLLGTGLIQG